jgi:hypothetical protein
MTPPELNASKPANPILVFGITLIIAAAIGGGALLLIGLDDPRVAVGFDYGIALFAALLFVTESRTQEDDFSWKSLTLRAVINGLIAVIAVVRSLSTVLMEGHYLLGLVMSVIFLLPFLWRAFIGVKAYRRSLKQHAYLDGRNAVPSAGATLLIVLGVLTLVLLPFLKRAQK